MRDHGYGFMTNSNSDSGPLSDSKTTVNKFKTDSNNSTCSLLESEPLPLPLFRLTDSTLCPFVYKGAQTRLKYILFPHNTLSS